MACSGAQAEAIGVAAADPPDLIDHIYEAGHAPQEWPKVVERILRLSGAAGAAVLLLNGRAPPQGWATPALSPFLEWLRAGDRRQFFHGSPGWHRFAGSPPENLTGFGLGAFLYAVLGPIVFILARWTRDGDYPYAARRHLDDLRPHLLRAARLVQRMREAHAEAAVALFETMNLPAAALAASGQIIARNALFTDQEAALLLRLEMAEPGERSIPVAGRGGGSAHVLHVLPLPQRTDMLFAEADRLVTVIRVAAGAFAPSPVMLAGLFRLTPGEAAIASRLAAGLTLKAAAAAGGLTVKSGRTYLDRIYRKTGTHQQSHLVALLKSIGPLGGGSEWQKYNGGRKLKTIIK